MQKNILVTGATGMVGSALTKTLKQQGHNVSILTRDPSRVHDFKAFTWDVYNQTIDNACMEGVDTVVHLAGEPVAEKKWTDSRKRQIIGSRVQSAHLLFKAIEAAGPSVKNFISASAVGYYGDRADELLHEESKPGQGFLAECCIAWEEAADKGLALGLRVAKIRVGIVLGKNDGSLPVMARPVKLFAGTPLGTGRQWMPWIHHEDIEGIFLKAITDDTLQGVFNGCAPHPATNRELTYGLAKALNRPVWPFNMPKKVLDIILGEQSILPLMSTRTSADKIIDAGYKFKFADLNAALAEIYS